MTNQSVNEPSRCSFCNASERDGKHLITGPGVFICGECVGICLDMLIETGSWDAKDVVKRIEKIRERNWPTPAI